MSRTSPSSNPSSTSHCPCWYPSCWSPEPRGCAGFRRRLSEARVDVVGRDDEVVPDLGRVAASDSTGPPLKSYFIALTLSG